MQWSKVTLVGVGLLAGSLGLALRQRRRARQVTGYVRRAASVEECRRMGVVDEATCDLRAAVAEADLVVLGTPISQMGGLVEQMAPAFKPGALLTDVGSVKEGLVEQLEPAAERAGVCYLGSHPMAGAEKNGVLSARAQLFEGAVCVITPTPRTPSQRIDRLCDLWSGVGGRPLVMPARLHDELVCRSSHLPHILAAELSNCVLSPLHPREQSLLCAGGFRDATRVASGSPEMWRDIVFANRHNLVRALDLLIDDLRDFQEALNAEDIPYVIDFFDRAKRRRDAWCEQGQSPE